MNEPEHSAEQTIRIIFALQNPELVDEIVVVTNNLIKEALTATRAQAFQEVREMVDNMRILRPVCDCKTHPEHNCGITSNDAIDDILTRLTENHD